jgi:hypothetical protein
VSSKVQIIRELFEMAKEIIYPPQPQQESPEEKRVKAATMAIKDLADVAVKLQAAEANVAALNKVVEKIDDELGKLKAIAVLAVALSIAATLIAVLLK